MKIIHLEKTFENVIANMNNDVLFLKATKSNTRDGGFGYQFTSKRIQSIALQDIQKYLDDPRVALITVEM